MNICLILHYYLGDLGRLDFSVTASDTASARFGSPNQGRRGTAGSGVIRIQFRVGGTVGSGER